MESAVDSNKPLSCNVGVSTSKFCLPTPNRRLNILPTTAAGVYLKSNQKYFNIIIHLYFCRYNGKKGIYYIEISIILKNRAIFTFMAVKKDV
jgi:hypothetical protein